MSLKEIPVNVEETSGTGKKNGLIEITITVV